MTKSSFYEELIDSPSNTTTINDQIESLFDSNHKVETSQKKSEQYEHTGLLNTVSNIDLEPEEKRYTGTTIKVRPTHLAQRIGMEKIERRQKPSIGTCHVSPKAKVGIILQNAPKMIQNRPKQMTAQTVKARPLDRKITETPISKISFLPTSLRTRSHKIGSCKELKKDQEEKVTNFKARPLNKKILQSKGELGLFSSVKRRTTVPREFRFATNERIPPLKTVNNAEFNDKITLCLESPKKKLTLRNTIPRPFCFQTDKRGTGEEKSRHHTKHPVRLDTLVRREKEIQYEEANMRILKRGPTPVRERIRIPLILVQVHNQHVEQRANKGTKFDKKLKEKNTAKMVGEENSSKPDTKHVPRFNQSFLPLKYRSSKGVINSLSRRSDVDGKSKLVVTAATSSAASNMR